MSRVVKQLIIGGFYLAILLGVIWLAYRVVVTAPTCPDGVQNGGEDGVDCGATSCGRLCPTPILPLTISSPTLLKAGTGFDVLVHLENPNPLYGAARVDYVVTVTDEAGTVVATRRGNTYVNPAQPRYMLFPLTGVAAVPVKAELQIDEAAIEWRALTVDAKGDIQFGVRNELLTPSSGSLRFEAAVLNRSKFDFNTVDVAVLLKNAAGDVVSANTTVQQTLVAGESRGFVMEWPFAVSEAVRAQTIVTTNVFANDNFIRAYGSQEPDRQF